MRSACQAPREKPENGLLSHMEWFVGGNLLLSINFYLLERHGL
jgi:hypothetical protein